MLNIDTKLKLMVGYFFLLFDYSIDVGPMNFVALPTFIGFFLIWWGAADMVNESAFFEKLKKLSLIMTPVFFVIYLNNMYDLLSRLLKYILSSNPENAVFVKNTTALFGFIQFTISVLLLLSIIYAVYLTVCGFKELADKKGGAYPSYGRQLFNTFQIYAVLKAIELIILTLSTFGTSTVAWAGNIFSLCAYVPSVMFLVQSNRLYNLLYPKK